MAFKPLNLATLNLKRLRGYRQSLIARMGGLTVIGEAHLSPFKKLEEELQKVKQEILLRRQIADALTTNEAEVEATKQNQNE
jgi:predicted transcriptional regulator